MGFDPNDEPCGGCGREIDECLCGFAPDSQSTEEVEYDDTWEEDSDSAVPIQDPY